MAVHHLDAAGEVLVESPEGLIRQIDLRLPSERLISIGSDRRRDLQFSSTFKLLVVPFQHALLLSQHKSVLLC